jgi:lipopolysaccharide export system protein LptA
MYRNLLALLLFVSAGGALALESDSTQPIELAADSVDFNEAEGRSVYKGNVDVRQGSIRLRGDVVTVYQAGRDPEKVVAEGRPVKFEQRIDKGLVQGEALRVEYEVASENIILIGEAVLNQGKDTMRSDRIVYDRVKSVVKAGAAAKGKQRVHISIQPPGK